MTKALKLFRFSHVIEHLIDPVGVLKAVSSKIAPGGLVYITQPTFPVLRSDSNPTRIQDAVFSEHLHFFNPISLCRMLERLDCEIQTLFAFQNETRVNEIYADQIDIEYASLNLTFDEKVTHGYRDELGAPPYYCGENIVLFARKALPRVQSY